MNGFNRAMFMSYPFIRNYFLNISFVNHFSVTYGDKMHNYKHNYKERERVLDKMNVVSQDSTWLITLWIIEKTIVMNAKEEEIFENLISEKAS